jgi:hypothetical protein
MLAGIGPVKPFLAKRLIARSEAYGRTEQKLHTRSHAHEKRGVPCRAWGIHGREPGQRGDRRRHAAGEAVLVEVPAPQRARSARVSRLGDRTGGGAAYSKSSLVSAEMLAGIGPVKPLLYTYLITNTEACDCTADSTHTQPHTRAATHAPNWR